MHAATSPIARHRYTSERPPLVNIAPVYIMVGATLNETIHAAAGKDLIAYFYDVRDEAVLLACSCHAGDMLVTCW